MTRKRSASWQKQVTGPVSPVECYNQAIARYRELLQNPKAQRYIQHTVPLGGHSVEALSRYDENRCEDASDHGASLLAEKLINHLLPLLPRVPHHLDDPNAAFAGYDTELPHAIYLNAQTVRDAEHRIHSDVDAHDTLLEHLPKSAHKAGLADDVGDVYRAAVRPPLRQVDKALHVMREDIERMQAMRGTNAAMCSTEQAILEQCIVMIDALTNLREHSTAAVRAR